MMVVEPLHHHISKKPFCSITIIFFKKVKYYSKSYGRKFPSQAAKPSSSSNFAYSLQNENEMKIIAGTHIFPYQKD